MAAMRTASKAVSAIRNLLSNMNSFLATALRQSTKPSRAPKVDLPRLATGNGVSPRHENRKKNTMAPLTACERISCALRRPVALTGVNSLGLRRFGFSGARACAQSSDFSAQLFPLQAVPVHGALQRSAEALQPVSLAACQAPNDREHHRVREEDQGDEHD